MIALSNGGCDGRNRVRPTGIVQTPPPISGAGSDLNLDSEPGSDSVKTLGTGTPHPTPNRFDGI